MPIKSYPSALKEYFLLKARCVTQNNVSFWLDWDVYEGAEFITNANGLVTDVDMAQFYADRIYNQEGYVIFYEECLQTQPAPLCFSLSTLQEEAFSLFDYDSEEVFTVAQSLYDKHGAITYPHTDCEYLPNNQFFEANELLNNLKEVDSSLAILINKAHNTHKSAVWNDKKITGHHAIIPTQKYPMLLTNLSKKEKDIYLLIIKRYIAQFFNDYEYIKQSTACMIYDEPFDSSCYIPINSGWSEVFIEFDEPYENGILPTLLEKELIICKEVRIDRNYYLEWSVA